MVVRIGVLGAARIAPSAVIRPARHVEDARVVLVASRDPERAARFARKHGIDRVAESYQALLEDPEVDAVYNPLPNGLHAKWTLAAIEAGKHVLCEKPFTANAAEAERVAEAAGRHPDLVVMEAFHYRYHPFARRVAQIMAAAELGRLERVEAAICFPLPKFSDIRYRLDLAGGAMMDAGCYSVHLARLLGGEEPQVTGAKAALHSPQVDRAMTAELRFPSGHTGRVVASLWSSSLVRMSARARGERGRLVMHGPLAPNVWNRLSISVDGGRRVEHFPRRATFDYQLEAFGAAIRGGNPVLTPPADSIANMRVIDDTYRAAGLQPRGTS
jgi:predicted dehydrogenase